MKDELNNPREFSGGYPATISFLILLFALGIGSSGCSWYVTPYVYQKTYSGEVRPEHEIARIRTASDWSSTDRPFFKKIDDTYLDTDIWDFQTYKVEVLPGMHEFFVVTPQEDSNRRLQYHVVRIKFSPKAGNLYEVSDDMPPTVYRIEGDSIVESLRDVDREYLGETSSAYQLRELPFPE